jgi:hypothetical protein
MLKSGLGYANTRTRLQRLNDAKFFSGWVTDFDEVEVRIRLNVSGECEPGDRFLVEIYGTKAVASFQAEIEIAFDNQVHLAITPPVKYRSTTETARMSVSDMYGVIEYDGSEMDARVADISREGMGLVVKSLIPKDAEVTYRIASPVGEVRGLGQVRYCRMDPSGNGLYRLGLRILQLSRIEQAKWLRLVDRDAA